MKAPRADRPKPRESQATRRIEEACQGIEADLRAEGEPSVWAQIDDVFEEDARLHRRTPLVRFTPVRKGAP